MISDEIVAALSRYFASGAGPSHDELSRAFGRAGLSDVDPGPDFGKVKRVREVLTVCVERRDDARSLRAIKSIVAALQVTGAFRPGSPAYAGDSLITATKEAFARVGVDFGADGDLRPRVLSSLAGRETTDALRAYVNRIRAGNTDAALVVGTGKDLIEATAAHVLVERRGDYPKGATFRGLLGMAYVALGLTTPEAPSVQRDTPIMALERGLFEVACAVNRMRNREGAGHGRPFLPSIAPADARRAAEAAAVVAELLLDRLEND